MSAETIAAIIGAVVTVAGSEAGLAWWAYQRGLAQAVQHAGFTARIEALERQVSELLSKRRRFW